MAYFVLGYNPFLGTSISKIRLENGVVFIGIFLPPHFAPTPFKQLGSTSSGKKGDCIICCPLSYIYSSSKVENDCNSNITIQSEAV